VTPEQFRERFGCDPEHDDLHRVSCEQAGEFGHAMCGICAAHDKPRFLCGCVAVKPVITHAAQLKLAELEPELMREFAGRPIMTERGRMLPAGNAVRLEDVEDWLRSRGVIATVEMQRRTLVPVAARLVEES
jgi:hypothetical protein